MVQKLPVHISYPSTVNQIYEYLDARSNPMTLRYIISIDKKLN